MPDTCPTVAHLVPSLEIGGMEVLILQFIQARLERQPESAYLYCLDAPGELAARLPAPLQRCFQADRSRRPFDLGCVRRLRQALHQDGIQVLHTHNTAACLYGALATLAHPASAIYTQHGACDSYSLPRRLKQRWLTALNQMRLIGVSHDTADRMHRLQGFPADRIQVIHNGVTPHDTSLPEDLQRPPAGLVLGYLGGLKPVKAWDRFLPLLAQQMQRQHDLHLMLIGDGPCRADLEHQAGELGIADRLTVTGYRDDGRRCLNLLDAFLLPSHSEGLSVALLEAMAAGLPCLVTDVGDSGRLVRESGGGRVLSKEQDEWQTELADFLAQPEALPRMGQLAQAHVNKHYTMQQTLEAYEQLYQQAI